MFKCLFGHSFGRIEPDGFQYCKTCGKAILPNLCENGHQWVETGENEYVVTSNYGQWKDYYVPQKCARCNERRSVKKY
jgi:hypothetical protein